MCQIKFRIDTRSKSEVKPIVMQVTHDSSQIKRGTNIRVAISDWDSKNGCPKDVFSNEFMELNQLRNDFFQKYELIKSEIGKSPSIEQLKQGLINCETKFKTEDFIVQEEEIVSIKKLIFNFINAKENIYSASRIHNYTRIKSLVHCFTKDKGFKDDYREVNKTWVLSFIDYLCYDTGYTNSTVESILKGLRAVLNFYDKDINFKLADVMKGMRGKKIKNEIPFLTMEDLEVIKTKGSKVNIDTTHLFLFCAYTGMRFNESQNINEDNIFELDGITLLRYTTSKNGSTIEVPLNNYCLNVLSLHKNRLPIMSNTTANISLHTILKECGFNKVQKIVSYNGKNRVEKLVPLHDLLTFHDSRKAFGCNLIEGGLDMQSVSDLMGIDIMTLQKWYSKSNKQDRNLKALNILNK